MQSQLTLAQARAQLAVYVPNAATEFTNKINQVNEIFTLSGKWIGSMVAAVFPAASGIITLPPELLSILSGKFDCVPVQSFSSWFSYLVVGPSSQDEASLWGWGGIVEIPGGFCTTVLQDDDGPIRIFSNAADNGAVCRIFGYDVATGQQIIDANGVRGESITLTAPFVNTTHSFVAGSSITGFTKPLTKNSVQVSVVPTNGNPIVQLADYNSWETNPSYTRYSIPSGINGGTVNVKVLCQRRPIAVSAESDYLVPDSIAADKAGLQALALSDSGYEAESLHKWTEAYGYLNAKSKSLRGGSQVPIPTNVFGWGNGIPFTN